MIVAKSRSRSYASMIRGVFSLSAGININSLVLDLHVLHLSLPKKVRFSYITGFLAILTRSAQMPHPHRQTLSLEHRNYDYIDYGVFTIAVQFRSNRQGV
jgi:hypothetical protein